jgi:NADPH-dependent 2,4-dienoyl-CoA reductase/sulfur reductase-like enzyme
MGDADAPSAAPLDLDFDPAALKAKYDAERERRLRQDGVEQYRLIEQDLSNYITDPYVKPGYTRDPLDIDCEVLIVGGGYGGQLIAARLMEAGVSNVKIVEKGGDFGGTW